MIDDGMQSKGTNVKNELAAHISKWDPLEKKTDARTAARTDVRWKESKEAQKRPTQQTRRVKHLLFVQIL